MIDAYRKHGHRLAKIDPLGIHINRNVPELNENLFHDGNYQIKNVEHLRWLCAATFSSDPMTKDEWIQRLNEIYCQSISLECEHIDVR